MAAHSSILAWRIPWSEKPGRLTVHEVTRVGHDWATELSWTVAPQAPLSMGFSRKEYWSGLPFPSLGDLSDPGIEPRSPALQADSLPTELQGKPQDNITFT